MRFDRDIFFTEYRKAFGSLKQYQVDNLNQLLNGYERYWGWWDDVRQISNSLAQVRMESAFSFGPVAEGYYLGDPNAAKYFIGNTPRVWQFQANLRYSPYFGRGHIQLTHLDNYADQTVLVKKYFPELVTDLEKRTGQRFDLASYPEQMFDPGISFAVMTIGMHLGTFRSGHTLDRYISPRQTDFDGARNIVNGDRNYKRNGVRIGEIIRRDSEAFLRMLKAALTSESSPTPEPIDEDILEIPSPVSPTVSANSLSQALDDLTPHVVPAVVTEPQPAASEPSNTAADTPPDDPPASNESATLTVEDWKPWVFKWLKRVWQAFAGSSSTLFSGFSLAGIADTPNLLYWLIAAAVVVVLIGGAAVIVSVILLAIWFLNRREIKSGKELEARSAADPTVRTVKLKIERKE